MISAILSHDDIAEILIEHGADIHLRSNVGSNALWEAASLARAKVFRMLVEKGADPYLEYLAARNPLMTFSPAEWAINIFGEAYGGAATGGEYERQGTNAEGRELAHSLIAAAKKDTQVAEANGDLARAKLLFKAWYSEVCPLCKGNPNFVPIVFSSIKVDFERIEYADSWMPSPRVKRLRCPVCRGHVSITYWRLDFPHRERAWQAYIKNEFTQGRLPESFSAEDVSKSFEAVPEVFAKDYTAFDDVINKMDSISIGTNGSKLIGRELSKKKIDIWFEAVIPHVKSLGDPLSATLRIEEAKRHYVAKLSELGLDESGLVRICPNCDGHGNFETGDCTWCGGTGHRRIGHVGGPSIGDVSAPTCGLCGGSGKGTAQCEVCKGRRTVDVLQSAG